MTTKQYLAQILVLNKRIQKLELNLTQLEATDFYSGGTISSEKVKSTRQNNAMQKFVERKITLADEIQSLKSSLNTLTLKIQLEIEQLENIDLKVILSYRYINLYNFEKIAEIMNFSNSHIYYVHRNALREFEKFYPTINNL